MEKNAQIETLSALSDDVVLEEAATRLRTQFARESGGAFLYGTFRFIFHEGRFQGVEDWPRNKRYVSPKRNEEKRKENK